MKVKLLEKISGTANKTLFKVKKHSPEILVGAGIVGVVATTVVACKATTKLEGILQESKEKKDIINNYVEENGYSSEYSEADKENDLKIVQVQTCVNIAKNYIPAVLIGTASIVSILAGYNILRKRNVALVAAYTAVDTAFKGYRNRVAERFGEEVEHEIRYNMSPKEVTITDENGNETTETKYDIDNNFSEYSVIFDEGNVNWADDAIMNKKFLMDVENWANDKLRSKRVLFLNDVREALGFSPVPEGQIVGWVYDEDNPIGDNYVDFGIFSHLDYEPHVDFINGIEKSIILDFNVDGPVFDKL